MYKHHFNHADITTIGNWTPYGTDMIRFPPRLSTHALRFQETNAEDAIPSARTPASLQVDPMVRRRASKEGMRVSEHAIWMMVVGAQEYMKSVIQKTITSTRNLNSGYASELPRTDKVTVMCSQQKPSTISDAITDSHDPENASKSQRFIIGAAELSEMLASEPLVAGGASLSRMARMRCSISNAKEAGRGFVKVNDLIAYSLQLYPSENKNAEDTSKAVSIYPTSISLQPQKKPDSRMLQKVESLVPPSSASTTQLEHKINSAPPYRPLAKASFHPMSSLSTLPRKEDTSLSAPDAGLGEDTSTLVSREKDSTANNAP